MKESLTESFLSGQNTNLDNYFTSIRNCWFLNSNSSEVFYIRCLRQSFYSQYLVGVIDKDGRPVSSNNICSETSLEGTWSALLVKIFNVRYVVMRTASGFQIMFDNDDQSDIFINLTHINKVTSAYDVLKLGTYAVIHKTGANRLTIGTYPKFKEVVAGRAIMLLLLAYSFPNKFNSDYRTISHLKSSSSIFVGFLKNNRIKKMISDCQNFRDEMISCSPFKENQVHDLELMWDYILKSYNLERKTYDAFDRIQSLCLQQDRMYDRREVFYAVLAVVIGFAGLVQNFLG